jgi:chemotaxis protein CheD
MNLQTHAPAGPVATEAELPYLSGAGRRVIVGIGEYAVSDRAGDVIVTHALGSCVAVCVFDPVARVGGLIHILLPESRINRTRAAIQPAAFADSGIPLLFETAYKLGAQKKRCVVHLIGGAEVNTVESGGGAFNIGRRNILAAKNTLWKNGVLIQGESVGGSQVRTVNLAVAVGRIQVTCGRETLVTL